MKGDGLFQLGMDLGIPSAAAQEEEFTHTNDGAGMADARLAHQMHLQMRNGVLCAGAHLIVDLYNAQRLDDMAFIEQTLRDCVEAAGATLLHIHLHHFEPNGGVSGVAVLAESHISIHSWPEVGYAALDVFMCGDAHPEATVPVLREAFQPERIAVSEHLRGRGL
jgi:S-adenosylmethionine decarboxylase